jgi:hypothetical protein
MALGKFVQDLELITSLSHKVQFRVEQGHLASHPYLGKVVQQLIAQCAEQRVMLPPPLLVALQTMQ